MGRTRPEGRQGIGVTAVAALILTCAVLCAGCGKPPAAGRTVQVIFRYDDYSAISSTELEQKIIDLFRGLRATITFSVIPFVCGGDQRDPAPCDQLPLSSAKGEILKSAVRDGTVDAALHGYSHQTNDSSPPTEFAGLAYADQLVRLATGRTFLERMIDTPVSTFVPPWNRYDRNTLRALEESGFSMLSASKPGVAAGDSKLLFLPVTCELDRLREAVSTARESADDQPVVVVLLHGYDFREVDQKNGRATFSEFAGLVRWLQSQSDVRILSLGQACKVIRDLSARRFLDTQRDYFIHSMMPVNIRAANPSIIYAERASLALSILRIGLYYVAVIALGGGVALAVTRFLPRRFVRIGAIVTIACVALCAILLTKLRSDSREHPKRLTAAAILVGVSIGTGVGVWDGFRGGNRPNGTRAAGRNGGSPPG